MGFNIDGTDQLAKWAEEIEHSDNIIKILQTGILMK